MTSPRSATVLAAWLACAAVSGPPAAAQTVGGVPTTPGVHFLQFTDTANPFVINRTYALKIPAGYVHGSGTQHRFLLLLHGAGQTLASFLAKPHILDFATRADASGVILLAPQGWGLSWNAAHCCAFAALADIDDVAFIDALVNELLGALDIDAQRVHMAGYSNGGMMVHRLAAELTSLFASGASVAGPVGGFDAPLLAPAPACEPYDAGCADWSALKTPAAPADPIPMMMIRGLRDDTIVYEGGSRTNSRVWHLPAVANTAAPEATDYAYWAAINGCAEQPIAYHPQGQLRECLAGAAGQADTTMVSLCGMTHEWPSLSNSAEWDGVEHIVQFLDSHP